MGILLSLISTLLGVSEKEQQARISWWLGGHVNDTDYSGLWKRETPWSHWSVWELPCWYFIIKRQLMRMWSRRLRKHARTSEELGEKKISRGNRTKQDQRETKTSFHVGTTWGKQRKKLVSRGWERNVQVIWYMRRSFQEEKEEPGWRKKMKSKMVQALQNKIKTKRKTESKPTHDLIKERVLLQNKTWRI